MRKLDEYEELLLDYCEINPMIVEYQAAKREYEILQKTPEYKNQIYTFKYGNYNLSNYLIAQ